MTSELCSIMSKLGEKDNFKMILSLIYSSVEKKIKIYKKNNSYINLSIIKNYIIFFMILFLNIKQSDLFIKTVFEEGTNFFHSLISLLKKLNSSIQSNLLGILNNLFMIDYKSLYFKKNSSEKDEKLEHIFIINQTNFSNIYTGSETIFGNEDYKRMFNILSSFDLSYDNFFKNNDIKISNEDKTNYKLSISQSIIRVAFSKEKTKFIDNQKEENQYFEYYFIKKVIEKDMEDTKNKFGDDFRTLFRKEDLCDDILKYMFFIFGNTMMVESFVKPVEKMLKKIGIDEETIKTNILASLDLPLLRDINVDEFEVLICEIIENLYNTIPQVLKILLKLLYNGVIKYFTIDKNNYAPLYTSLMFNFILSPRVQELYSINPMKILLVRSLNRLVRNTCFNYKFPASDELNKFNDLIEINHKKLTKFMVEKIIEIDDDDKNIKNSLKDLFTEKYLVYPKFLFYYDSEILCKTIKGGEDKIINFKEIKINEKLICKSHSNSIYKSNSKL